jgi:hypothetical protein
MMILVEVLTHVFKLVQVSELSLFVIHDDLFFFFDGLDDLLHFVVEVDVHTLDVISFGFKTEEAQELFLFFFQVDWFLTFAHATWRIRAKAKEISKNIIGFCSGFPVLPGSILTPGRAW